MATDQKVLLFTWMRCLRYSFQEEANWSCISSVFLTCWLLLYWCYRDWKSWIKVSQKTPEEHDPKQRGYQYCFWTRVCIVVGFVVVVYFLGYNPSLECFASNYYQGEGGLGVLLKIKCNTSSYSGFCFFKFPTFLQ